MELRYYPLRNIQKCGLPPVGKAALADLFAVGEFKSRWLY
jgi:hypothetical protein